MGVWSKAILIYLSIVVACVALDQLEGATSVPRVSDGPVVRIKGQGLVRGSRAQDGEYYEYSGIPYAKATPENRFKSSLPVPTWEGIKEANVNEIACPQYNRKLGKVVGKEDCLVLNVYTPMNIGLGQKPPVMVFIHGGGYNVGSGDKSVYGPRRFMKEDVILVTFNYRLGIFGFLCTGDTANAGLKDAVAVLKWVQAHIEAFGGDPKKVTIFGQSAGGAMVELLALSKNTIGLFDGVIALSGLTSAFWAIGSDPEEKVRRVAKQLGYEGQSQEERLRVLKNATIEDLVVFTNNLALMTPFEFLPVSPCIEPSSNPEAIFTDDPINVIRSGDYNHVPFIQGFTKDDGLLIYGFKNFIDMLRDDFVHTIPKDLQTHPEAQRIADAVKSFYFGTKNISEESMHNAVELSTDTNYVLSSVKSARRYIRSGRKSPVYMYEFACDGGLPLYKYLFNLTHVSGVCHADDLGYMFTQTVMSSNRTDDEITAKRLVKLWTNFAKYSGIVMYRLVLATALAGLLLASGFAQNIDISINDGPISGTFDEELRIRSFLGIPYGVVDPSNRFKAPRAPEQWTESLVTNEFTKVCPQVINNAFVGEENCLMLNVFAPEEGENLPVLFHVHGGELQHGSASPEVYGPQRLIPKGIILVVPNYRLGALGFMCLRNELAPGNAGLKDLQLALQWVYDNIEYFGGDPDKITVSGEGTGGGAAGFLIISPTTRHMISKFITESGSVLSPWILDRDPVNRGRILAESLPDNVEDDNVDDLEFLKELEVNVITGVAAHHGDFFRVCIESTVNNTDAFLTATPFHLMQTANTSIPMMIGYANGAGMREASKQTSPSMECLESNPYSLLPVDLTFPSTASRSNAALRIKNQYFGDETIRINKREEYMNYYTDVMYLGPALRAARLLAERSSVFFYEFGYDGGLNHVKKSLGSSLLGAARGDITGYVFGHQDLSEAFTEDDQRMANVITDLWANFIMTGIPELSEAPPWSPLTTESDHVLNITNALKLSEGVHSERMQLWDDLYATNYIDCPSSASVGKLFAWLLVLGAIALRA